VRPGVIATLAAITLAACCAPAAGSATREWSASGSLSGTYANRIAWVACQDSGAAATTQENLTLDARISALHPTPYAHGGIVLSMAMAPHPGGSWTVDGSVPPRVEQVNPNTGEDTVACGPPEAIHCTGSMVRDGSLMQLAIRGTGATLAGNFFQNAFVKESDDPDSACTTSDIANPVGLFGLAGTDIEPDVFAENDAMRSSIPVPRADLRRDRPFTITRAATPDGGCTPQGIEVTECSQTGSLTLTLHLVPRTA
jgi:hypothetical protein